jgi:hypothetical protein
VSDLVGLKRCAWSILYFRQAFAHMEVLKDPLRVTEKGGGDGAVCEPLTEPRDVRADTESV